MKQLLLTFALFSGFAQNNFAAQAAAQQQVNINDLPTPNCDRCCLWIVTCCAFAAAVGHRMENSALESQALHFAHKYNAIKTENEMLRDQQENTYRQFMQCRTELLEAKLKAITGETKKKK